MQGLIIEQSTSITQQALDRFGNKGVDWECCHTEQDALNLPLEKYDIILVDMHLAQKCLLFLNKIARRRNKNKKLRLL